VGNRRTPDRNVQQPVVTENLVSRVISFRSVSKVTEQLVTASVPEYIVQRKFLLVEHWIRPFLIASEDGLAYIPYKIALKPLSCRL